MAKTGPRGPCSCGSGLSYADCCGAREPAPTAAMPASSGTRESALTKLLTFAFQPAFDSDHTIAETIFWGDLLRSAAPHEVQWLMDSEDANVKYNSWFLFDWDVDGQGTVADLFLEDEDARLTKAEHQFLVRMMEANLRLYEVEGVEPGHGVHLCDLWSGTRRFVIEHKASLQMVNWDLLGARVAPDGYGDYVFEGGLYLYPAEMKATVLGQFRRLHRRHHRKFPTDDSAAFFRKHGMVFHHLWLELVAFPEPPEVVTSEGDPLVFCRAVFDTPHAEEVRTAIAAQPDVEAVEEGRFALYDSADGPRREVGRWGVEGQRIVFETTSQARVAKGRSWLEALAGDRVRYRATALETLAETMNALRRQAGSAPPPVAHGDDQWAVRELFDRHYGKWLDRPVPALGNRTPRAAARAKLWRPRVVDLLKQLENDSERAVLQGRPRYDFAWIWRELGIERPEIS